MILFDNVYNFQLRVAGSPRLTVWSGEEAAGMGGKEG